MLVVFFNQIKPAADHQVGGCYYLFDKWQFVNLN